MSAPQLDALKLSLEAPKGSSLEAVYSGSENLNCTKVQEEIIGFLRYIASSIRHHYTQMFDRSTRECASQQGSVPQSWNGESQHPSLNCKYVFLHSFGLCAHFTLLRLALAAFKPHRPSLDIINPRRTPIFCMSTLLMMLGGFANSTSYKENKNENPVGLAIPLVKK